jgi:hypothetical protein
MEEDTNYFFHDYIAPLGCDAVWTQEVVTNVSENILSLIFGAEVSLYLTITNQKCN